MPVNHEVLSDVLTTFASRLVTGYEITDILDALCHRVAEVLPVTGAGVMLADEAHTLMFVAASDDVVRRIEGLQIDMGEGPCLHAYQTGEQVVVADLRSSDRFPKFAPRALEEGLCAVFSFPMRTQDDSIGALNLYRDSAGGFDRIDVEAGQLLADVATSYIVNARIQERATTLAAQLQHALDSRVVIEQAKGYLAASLDISITEAFELLRRHSRDHGSKVRTVAQQVLDGSVRLGLGR